MIFKLLFLVFSIASHAHATLGGEVGNGGDTVECSASNANAFRGLYSLDYLMTLQEDNSDIITVQSWEASRERLRKLFPSKFPDMAIYFEEFLAGNPFGKTVSPDHRYIQKRIWDEAPYGLIDIKDERIVRKLPSNCYKLKAPFEIDIIQGVVRQKKGDVTFFDYDPALLRKIKTENPLQFSFLLIHEFLWDFTEDVSVVRRANRFIHSNLLEKLTAAQLKLSLENIGVGFKKSPPTPVCDRTAEVRSALEHVYRRPCSQITLSDLYASASLDLKASDIAGVLPGDLSGFTSISTLNLANNHLTHLFVDMFYDFPRNFYSLDIRGNRIVLDSWDFLKGVPHLHELNISDNQLTNFPSDLSALPRSLQKFNISNNLLESLPEDFFDALEASFELNLSRNRLTSLPELKGNMQWLQVLDVNDNPLKVVPSSLLKAYCRERSKSEFRKITVAFPLDKTGVRALPLDAVRYCVGKNIYLDTRVREIDQQFMNEESGKPVGLK